MSISFRAFAVICTMMLVGGGCWSSVQEQIRTPEPTGPKPAAFDGVSPEEAAQRINFVPGSIIETRQTFLGFGAKLSAKLAGEKKEGVRVIVVERFAPMETAKLRWSLVAKTETEESQKAREQARKQGKTEPEPVITDHTTQGALDGIDLRNGSSLYPPAYWPEKEDATGLGTSAIWLSDTVFQGLARNRVATLDLGLLDAQLQGVTGASPEFKALLKKLQDQMKKVEDRTDVFQLQGDKDPVTILLNVNGKDVQVQVLKAHTWFGDIVVLNNRQNPIVLKMTLNPLASGASELITGAAPLKALLGYEVTAIRDVQDR